MELLFIILFLLAFLATFFITDEYGHNLGSYMPFTLWALFLCLWLNLSKPTYDRIEIQSILVEGKIVKVYEKNGAFIPVPNNTDHIEIRYSRWGSVEKPRYKIIY